MELVTLRDITKRLDPGGSIAVIAEILDETNEILIDMPMVECNNGDGHKSTIRNSLPEVDWRQFNYGVKSAKSDTQQVTDPTGMLEAYSKVDMDLAMLNGNTKEFRLSEDKAFIESMNQKWAKTIFYGNTNSNAKEFMGLAARYNHFASDSGTSADHVIDCGGTSSTLTSVYLIGWASDKVFSVYPNGSKAGLLVEDQGQKTVTDGNGGEFEALVSRYQAKAGLVVRDYRYVVRLANIDSSLLKADPASGDLFLVDKIIDAIEMLPSMNGCKPVFYGNKKVVSALRKQIKNSKNVTLSLDEVAGKKVLHIDGIPFRKTDALINAEARIVALP